ncbi:sugar ABC transporter ATP-binding protein [Rubellimicrobium arenae]|uniref:sugar ABC transporter ATP-binding protein n=1 Tax=Rubellimicrobium arenae TaxID=2817372 RepID=UPI001B318239|nr:sugar ABC transporter ATP-binding protein [Rubellimicrobium arenae]
MLTAENLRKSYAGVEALRGVSFEVRPGEVVGLVGENGAGKSTLMRLLAGTQRPSGGRILRDGQPVSLASPRDANAMGIAMVFQEQSLILNLSVAENLFLGQDGEFVRHGLIDRRALRRAALHQLAKVGLDIDPDRRAGELSFAQRQMVELAKALALEDRVDRDLVILLDEPTSVLEQAEIDLLFSRVRDLQSRASFVFVSHRLDEVLAISDRVYVMRDGAVVAEAPASAVTPADLHQMMVGRGVRTEYYLESRQEPPRSDVALAVRGLGQQGAFRDVSFDLHRGEVLGLAGVIGSGREALIRVLFGFERPDAGGMEVEGQAYAPRSPADAVARGLGFVPSERRTEGLVMTLSLGANITLARIREAMTPWGLSRSKEQALARDWISRLGIRTPSADTPCRNLSGGNQQKVVLAKWRTAGSRVLILDHPTRGVDVGAKEEVFRLIRDLCDEGVAILLVADTLEETIGLSHRVLVMRDGAISAELPAPAGGKPEQVRIVEHMV